MGQVNGLAQMGKYTGEIAAGSPVNHGFLVREGIPVLSTLYRFERREEAPFQLSFLVAWRRILFMARSSCILGALARFCVPRHYLTWDLDIFADSIFCRRSASETPPHRAVTSPAERNKLLQRLRRLLA